jgi:hypothetical protein
VCCVLCVLRFVVCRLWYASCVLFRLLCAGVRSAVYNGSPGRRAREHSQRAHQHPYALPINLPEGEAPSEGQDQTCRAEGVGPSLACSLSRSLSLL